MLMLMLMLTLGTLEHLTYSSCLEIRQCTYSPLSSVLCRFTVTGERDARPRCATRRLCVSRLPPTHPSDPPISSVGSQGFACRGRRWLTPGGPPARADPRRFVAGSPPPTPSPPPFPPTFRGASPPLPRILSRRLHIRRSPPHLAKDRAPRTRGPGPRGAANVRRVPRPI
ncbi:hypothetical protein BHE74_00012567 [Ensete ventricosum]|nr:hypothetical protein BHE74_00012567 [Ensete ventricosum]